MKISLKKRLSQFNVSIDTNILDDGICVIFGRSGSGKTSFINMIAGIDKPDHGYIQINNQVFFDSSANINKATHKRNIGYVFQQSRLFPHLNVEQNLCYGYNKQKDKTGAFYQKIIALLDLTNLTSHSPDELSGGEKQRVAIGRAILSQPDLLLMDEPLASLDLPKKRELLPYLQNLNKSLSLPILYVTHSLDEVLFLADEMILLEQGRCVLQGDIESVWNHPKMHPWLNATNQCSVLTAKISHQHQDYPLTALSMSCEQHLWVNKILQPVSTNVRLRIYAKDISLTTIPAEKNTSSIRNILATKIEDIIIEEQNVKVKLSFGENILWSEITLWALHDLNLKKGQSIYAQIKGVSVSDWVTD